MNIILLFCFIFLLVSLYCMCICIITAKTIGKHNKDLEKYVIDTYKAMNYLEKSCTNIYQKLKDEKEKSNNP